MLALDPSIAKIGEEAARASLKFGNSRPQDYGGIEQSRKVTRWGNGRTNFILDDAGNLLQLLFAEQANIGVAVNDAAESGTPVTGRETMLRRLKDIFHRVLPNISLTTTADNIMVTAKYSSEITSLPYSITQMSDGEKAVFYMVGQVLVADTGSIFIMDEPEIHMHRAILGRLWDELEAARPDCAFLLITHDLEFAASRAGKKYVVRTYAPETGWEIEEVPDAEGFSEELVTLILGSRKPVLFVEGEPEGSLDIAIYRACYPGWTVVPRGGCEVVIHSVASMRSNKALTRITCAGLVDADGRDSTDRQNLESKGVYVLPVAEIENVLLLPDVSRALLLKDDYDERDLDAKLAEVKSAIFDDAKVSKNVDEVVLSYCRRRIDQIVKKIDLSGHKSIGDIAASFTCQTAAVDIAVIAAEMQKRIADAVAADDLAALLAIYDRKMPLLVIATKLRPSHVKDFTAWVTRAIQSRDDDRLRKVIQAILPKPEPA
jgi:hypothetical protein